jgi:hypothetical protein
VCATGCDFTTIQAAIDNADTPAGAAIKVADPVHTEAGIVVNRDVTIQGQGADKTVVQAHATLSGSPDSVFFIAEGATVSITDLIVRHGNPHHDEEDWRCGGGIANKGTLTLENCIGRATTPLTTPMRRLDPGLSKMAPWGILGPGGERCLVRSPSTLSN